jgi:exodeoxyribonuclease-3
MRIVSWNVNGVRAVVKKEFTASLEGLGTDILCLQETKAQCEQVAEALGSIDDYHLYTNSAEKKGYSGTAILSRKKPIEVYKGLRMKKHDTEGRVLAAEFSKFFLVTVYTPNSGSELKRLDYRQEWDKAFLAYLKKLEVEKPVIVCGDLNVAHRDIDIARPKANYNKTAGYMQEEIDGFDNLMKAGFIDTYRYLNPESVKYSWWSFRANARAKNVGWRIDYFLTSSSLQKKLKAADIDNNVHGSDHCPVILDIAI